MTEPKAAVLRMWGAPSESLNAGPLEWDWAQRALEDALIYWLVTSRDQDSPHATPVWGVWMDDRLLLTTGARPHNRNIETNPRVTVHLESGSDVVILKGTAHVDSSEETVGPFLEVYNRKYSYNLESHPALVVTPESVMAWRAQGEAARDGFATAGKWEF